MIGNWCDYLTHSLLWSAIWLLIGYLIGRLHASHLIRKGHDDHS